MRLLYGLLTSLKTSINSKLYKFALKICSKDWKANYPDLLDLHQTPTLDAQRQYLSLSHLFKIMQGLCSFPNAPIAKYSNSHHTRSQEANHLVQPMPGLMFCTAPFPGPFLSGTHYHHISHHVPHYYHLNGTGLSLVNKYFTNFYTINICRVHIHISVCKHYLCVHCICINMLYKNVQ